MNKQIPIETKHIVETIKSFLAVNEGDDATEELLINVGAEILDMSPDLFMEEYLQKEDEGACTPVSKEDFYLKIGGFNNYYSSFTVVGCTEELLLQALANVMASCVNGEDLGVRNGKHAFSFDLCKETPTYGKLLSRRLPEAVVFSDTSWDCHSLEVYKNGRVYHDYKVMWEPDGNKGVMSDDYEEEEEKYYDCDLIATDIPSGFQHRFGGGMCTEEEMHTFSEMVRRSEHVE